MNPVTAVVPTTVDQLLLRQPAVLVQLTQYISSRTLPTLSLAALRLFAALASSPRFEMSSFARGSRLVGAWPWLPRGARTCVAKVDAHGGGCVSGR